MLGLLQYTASQFSSPRVHQKHRNVEKPNKVSHPATPLKDEIKIPFGNLKP